MQFDVDSVGDREGRMAMLTATRAKMEVVRMMATERLCQATQQSKIQRG
jgi:hypothetical protein